jgi:hypothetical protein
MAHITVQVGNDGYRLVSDSAEGDFTPYGETAYLDDPDGTYICTLDDREEAFEEAPEIYRLVHEEPEVQPVEFEFEPEELEEGEPEEEEDEEGEPEEEEDEEGEPEDELPPDETAPAEPAA